MAEASTAAKQEHQQEKLVKLHNRAERSYILAFILGWLPGAGYVYLGSWRLAAVNVLTLHWATLGFWGLGPIHCAWMVRKARKAVAGSGEV